MPIFSHQVPRTSRKGDAIMRKTQLKTYQDLLVAVNTSKSKRSMDRLLQAERIARKTLTNEHDAKLNQSLKNTVARLVRWLDEPFPAQLAEALVVSHVRETTKDLTGKRVRNRVDLTCPICGMQFTPSDIKEEERVIRTCYRHDGRLVARYRCGQCGTLWEDTYALQGKKIVGEPNQRVVSDGRF